MLSFGRKRLNLDDESKLDGLDWIRVIERDESGPLVIAVDAATVFGDGGVESHDTTLESERFGVSGGKRSTPSTVSVDGSIAFIATETALRSEALDSLGPRLATVARVIPEVPVLVSPTRLKIAELAAKLRFTVAGTIVEGGRAWSADTVYLVRRAQSGTGRTAFDDLAQRRAFVAAMSSGTKGGDAVFLEHTDVGWGETRRDDGNLEFRSIASRHGLRLFSVGRRSLAETVDAVTGAPLVVIESPEIASYAQFANESATVIVLGDTQTPAELERALAESVNSTPKSKPGRRDEFTVTGEFNMDAAMRSGGPFPGDVTVLVSPSEPVAETTLARNQSFRGGRWHDVDDSALKAHSVGRWVFAIAHPRVNAAGDVVLRDGTRLIGAYFGAPVIPGANAGVVTNARVGTAGASLSMPNAFGHSLLQVMPRIESVHRERAGIPVLIGQRQWNDAPLVERLGIPANAVERIPQFEIDEYFEVPELIVSTHLQPHRRNARVDPAWLNDYVRRLTGDDIPAPTRKLYFARASDSGARGGCVNRDEFDRIADEFGFERIYPERYSIAEQIRMLIECAEMLGEQGSALNWAFVMQPGTRVTTLRNYPLSKGVAFETFHNTMLAAREVAYNDIAAFTVGNSAQYEIDPAIVREALRTLPN